MAVIEFKVEVALTFVPAIEELLGEREEQHLMVVEDKPSGRAWLTGYFESKEAAKRAWKEFSPLLELEWLATEPAIAELADKDWKESYKEHFKAWKFGHLHWVPVWEREHFRLPAGEEVLWLDPGMAFGTGNHETTRLVVERLVVLAGQRGTSARVIDAGCGSGILALSAVKLGFKAVAAFDNDAMAVEISRQNADLNLLTGAVDFYVGDLVTGLKGRRCDMLLANIQADVLIKYACELLSAVSPKGVLVMSGILATELASVRTAFLGVAPGWSVDTRTMGEWSDLVLVRP
jgi:ribosomal protein L11 methyltransferase